MTGELVSRSQRDARRRAFTVWKRILLKSKTSNRRLIQRVPEIAQFIVTSGPRGTEKKERMDQTARGSSSSVRGLVALTDCISGYIDGVQWVTKESARATMDCPKLLWNGMEELRVGAYGCLAVLRRRGGDGRVISAPTTGTSRTLRSSREICPSPDRRILRVQWGRFTCPTVPWSIKANDSVYASESALLHTIYGSDCCQPRQAAL
jgi:hypothetical protein